MPIIVQFEYEDGDKEVIKIPVEVLDLIEAKLQNLENRKSQLRL